VLGLWVLLLIKCSTSTFLSNVGLIHSHLPQQNVSKILTLDGVHIEQHINEKIHIFNVYKF
jgi:hypothetical protein